MSKKTRNLYEDDISVESRESRAVGGTEAEKGLNEIKPVIKSIPLRDSAHFIEAEQEQEQ